MTVRFDPHEHADYLDVGDCARRMDLTAAQVLELARHRVLRSLDLGGGCVLIQPAITNQTPPPP